VNFIYVVALGSVDEEALAAIELCLWQVFGVPVRRLPPLDEPGYAYDPQRKQYSSVAVLRKLLDHVPTDAVKLLAVTEKDLYIPMLSFVFGQAQLDGALAAVSLARLRQEFYGLPPNRLLLLGRAVKEAVHEVGHTFGLTHCTDSRCPMSFSNTISQVDRKGEDLCANCSLMLRTNPGYLRGVAGERS
jgi:archaemetzincin